MAKSAARRRRQVTGLVKAPTGIAGLDEITAGGLPRGRTSLVCGGPGTGKTVLGVELLVRGARDLGEPGVLMSFEETTDELKQNVASLGFDLDGLERAGVVSLDYVQGQRSEIEEIGAYDLEGLFVRLGHAIDSIGAKRVVLDTLEALFSSLSNAFILRAEIRRLFRWLNDRGLTTVVTAERGDGTLTRYGLEEYVSDFVLLLDNRIEGQLATRRVRIVKYRGSTHGADEYPFLLTEKGFSVVPITAMRLRHEAPSAMVSSGVERLDALLGGGLYEGSSVLVSGSPGTGKTSLGALFADAACGRGQRALYFSFEESPPQILRNMRSIGLDLQRWVHRGVLRVIARRPTSSGLEAHLVELSAACEEFGPSVVVVDTISALHGPEDETTAMLARLVDYFKVGGITSMFMSLTRRDGQLELEALGISSVIDTWISLRNVESNGERNRLLDIVKSRGIAHSNQVREFVITDTGVDLRNVYSGLDGMALGSARIAAEARERAEEVRRDEELARRWRTLETRRAAVEAQIAALRAELETEVAEVEHGESEERERAAAETADRAAIDASRRADAPRASPARRRSSGGRRKG
ncbi:MAG TPA: circadian clock protein KaiC [Solirubrobacteraceae bacterium]|nr:circadian clock protein KaiC [Solirubrobacteraceae bacterium]